MLGIGVKLRISTAPFSSIGQQSQYGIRIWRLRLSILHMCFFISFPISWILYHDFAHPLIPASLGFLSTLFIIPGWNSAPTCGGDQLVISF